MGFLDVICLLSIWDIMLLRVIMFIMDFEWKENRNGMVYLLRLIFVFKGVDLVNIVLMKRMSVLWSFLWLM